MDPKKSEFPQESHAGPQRERVFQEEISVNSGNLLDHHTRETEAQTMMMGGTTLGGNCRSTHASCLLLMPDPEGGLEYTGLLCSMWPHGINLIF